MKTEKDFIQGSNLNIQESSLDVQELSSPSFIESSLDVQELSSPSFISRNSITIAATSSAISSIIIGYPFDSIKTRMQAFKYPSTLHCVKSTLLNEGVKGFYRGVVPLLITSTSLRALGWNIYTSSKGKLQHFIFPKKEDKSKLVATVLPCTLAGMCTGFTSSILSAPIEFIKVQRQLQKVSIPSANIPPPTSNTTPKPGPPSKNLIGWLRHVIKQKGVAGLYTGYRFHAPMDIFGTGVYFAIYESFKYYGPKDEYGTPLPWVSVGGGGLAGAFSWVVVFPIDVIKSLVQKEGLRQVPKSAAFLVSERFKEFGIGGFYRGLSMQLVRSIPVHSLNFYVFESVCSYCARH